MQVDLSRKLHRVSIYGLQKECKVKNCEGVFSDAKEPRCFPKENEVSEEFPKQESKIFRLKSS